MAHFQFLTRRCCPALSVGHLRSGLECLSWSTAARCGGAPAAGDPKTSNAITAADAAGRYENEMSILDAGYENEDMNRWYWILTYDEIYSWIGSSINKVSVFFRPTDTPNWIARWCGDEVSVVAWKPWMPPWAPAILGDGDKDGANEGDIYSNDWDILGLMIYDWYDWRYNMISWD